MIHGIFEIGSILRVSKPVRKEGMCMQPRYLTKSRFKLAMECPTKLYYTGKPEYADQKLEDSFLEALAEGGFQVGELAKHYFPGGHDVKTLDQREALRQTRELMKQDQAIIYEAAVCYENLFVRVDILIKNGSRLELVEVKAKSVVFPSDAAFLNKDGSITSEWMPYLYDVAFQKYVLQQAMSECSVAAYLMLADKKALCPTDGLNQKFRIITDAKGRKSIAVSPRLSAEDLSVPILCRINADVCCDMIYSENYEMDGQPAGFGDYAAYLADCYEKDMKIQPVLTKVCAGCEFKATAEDAAKGLKSGFQECWKDCLCWKDEDFLEPNILEIWNFRKKDQYLGARCIKLEDLQEEDIRPKSDSKPGLSASQRQWLQVSKAKCNDLTYWIDAENLRREIDSWIYPLHFIDFETSMMAIPFNKGRHPYEGIAFQFSHHMVYEDGRIEHRGQYLNAVPGVFPNYDFLRSLKQALAQDEGSIFRYAAHENSFLNLIYRQLQEDTSDIPDREALCCFIRSITTSTHGCVDAWTGLRSMIDLCELEKRYYFDPATKGSNSIKYVLPAILNSSPYLQQKYSKPIYGAAGGIASLNYKDWQWIVMEDGKVLDPYKLLPKMFEDVSDKDFELLSAANELRDGGAAMTAYARMQFEEMSDYERGEIEKALLKYCELDTFAMVMIYEGWKAMIGC